MNHSTQHTCCLPIYFLCSRSRSPPAKRERSIDHEERRSRSPRHRKSSPPPSKGRQHSPTPEERSPRERGTPSPLDNRPVNGSEYGQSPKDGTEIDDRRYDDEKNMSPLEENDRSRSNSPIPRDNESPIENEKRGSPRGSESPWTCPELYLVIIMVSLECWWTK